METRHEEKYLIDYRQFSVLRARAEAAMLTDGYTDADGKYLITSVYYDDCYDSALDEKQDGVRVHTKYRARTYGASDGFIRLERKVKRGIMTEKHGVTVSPNDLELLCDPTADPYALGGRKAVMALEMRAKGLQPAVTVRYTRYAFVYPGTDTRLTFDLNVEALPPDIGHLFDDSAAGIPALPRRTVVMEVKYGEYLPAFVRKLASCNATQLSVSKYALCREVLRRPVLIP